MCIRDRLGFFKVARFSSSARVPEVLGVHAGWIVALALVALFYVYLRHSCLLYTSRCHVDGNKLIEAGKEKEGQAKLDEALQYYAQAYEAGLDRVGMLMSYGVLLMRRGEYEKAKEVYLRVHYKPCLLYTSRCV